MSSTFQPPPYEPHRWIRGGHLQTIASIHIRQSAGGELPIALSPRRHIVPLKDGDAIVMHEDMPRGWRPGDRSIVLIHGLCGCHAATYMLRLAQQFVGRGTRVFRLDMRGCGAGMELARQLTHAGRSDDVMAALSEVARQTATGPIGAIGVSLGGNQLLRAFGRVGCGADRRPDWFDRLDRIVAVSPPIDLLRCSERMQHWSLRPYNFYFIRQLLSRVPTQVQQRSEFRAALSAGRPRTLLELDDRITAPLSGFDNARDYYERCSAIRVTDANPVPSLVLAADDDPVVPVQCFTSSDAKWPESTEVLICPRGGHVGFIDRRRRSWMDRVIGTWFGQQTAHLVVQAGGGSISSATGDP